MTDERLLFGFLLLICAGVSFALTIVLFGFVVLAGLLLAAAGAAYWAGAGRPAAGGGFLMVAAAVLSGPLLYVGLALL